MILGGLFVLGLVFGSFIAALTWRIVHEIGIAKGRSFCDNCKSPISWYDNIPLFSFVFLNGKCRHCHKKISARYPIIELTTGLSFVGIYAFYGVILNSFGWLYPFGVLGLVFMFFVSLITICIVITDLSDMIIPDSFVFLLFIVGFCVLLLSPIGDIWVRLLTAFLASMFFLSLNLATRGNGMGLGDVKLALPFGLLLGFPHTVLFVFISFIVGAAIGVTLLLVGGANKKTKIPFGPFMVIGFWITVFFGQTLIKYFVPVF